MRVFCETDCVRNVGVMATGCIEETETGKPKPTLFDLLPSATINIPRNNCVGFLHHRAGRRLTRRMTDRKEGKREIFEQSTLENPTHSE